MNITKATVLYFTGTGTTERYAKAFAEALHCETNVQELRHDNPQSQSLNESDLLVVAGPVFGGYLPEFFYQQLEHVSGSHTPMVLLAVYGARDYDNALLEMDTTLSAQGFVTVGAAAVVARHSIVTTIAPDRPNASDIEEIKGFAHTIESRLADMDNIADAPTFAFKGNLDGHAAKNPCPLVSEDDCVQCGTCAAECPVGAIPEDEPDTTNSDLCISCMRCVEVCPHHARALSEQLIAGATAMLSQCADPTKKNEFF